MVSLSKMHFEISERKVLLRVFDVVFVLTSLHLMGLIFDFNYFKISQLNSSWTLVLTFYLLLFGSVFEMYNLQVASKQYQIIKSIVLCSTTTVLLYILTPFFTPPLPENRLQIILFFITVLLALLFWRILYIKFFASTRFFKKVILICDKEELQELVEGLANADPNYRIVGYIDSDSEKLSVYTYKDVINIQIENLEEFIKINSVSELVVASQKTDGITTNLYNKLIKLLENGFAIREYTQVYENLTQRIPVQYVARDFYKYFPFSRSNQNQFYLITTRTLDIFISILGLLFFFVLLPFIYLGNLIANRGKTFYTQERVGKNGELFKIFKLRSMIENAEKDGAVFASINDTRVTSFGKFLRKSRLDEVPQFLNILKGEMSVVGPRPERPFFVNEIASVMPFYETRHIIKPGITGWAQVNYSYGATLDESLIKLQYDLYYIKHRSVFLDINIIIKTISTILFYRGQ
jgi:exopolysaccharide biosynthesis polyprenyl glycosylphosphotransferase